MRPALPVLALGLAAASGGPALAQGARPEDARAEAAVRPLIEAQVPGYHAEVVAGCVVAAASSEERTHLARDPAAALRPLLDALLARPATVACIRRTFGG